MATGLGETDTLLSREPFRLGTTLPFAAVRRLSADLRLRHRRPAGLYWLESHRGIRLSGDGGCWLGLACHPRRAVARPGQGRCTDAGSRRPVWQALWPGNTGSGPTGSGTSRFSPSNRPGRLRAMVALAGSALAGIGFNLLFVRTLPARVRLRLVVGAWLILVQQLLSATLAVALRYASDVDDTVLAQDAGLGLFSLLLVAIAFTAAHGQAARERSRTDARPLTPARRRAVRQAFASMSTGSPQPERMDGVGASRDPGNRGRVVRRGHNRSGDLIHRILLAAVRRQGFLPANTEHRRGRNSNAPAIAPYLVAPPSSVLLRLRMAFDPPPGTPFTRRVGRTTCSAWTRPLSADATQPSPGSAFSWPTDRSITPCWTGSRYRPC